jgi:hypothetical protein
MLCRRSSDPLRQTPIHASANALESQQHPPHPEHFKTFIILPSRLRCRIMGCQERIRSHSAPTTRRRTRSIHKMDERILATVDTQTLPSADQSKCAQKRKTEHHVTAENPQTPDFETGLVPYDDKKIHIFITLLRSGLAMMFPAATMIVLYTVSRMLFRLLLVFVFSTLFTAVIALCTRARAIETFMATAA